MAKADSALIDWLIWDSGVSRYRISKETQVSESTLSRITNGDTPLHLVGFGTASRLTEYAKKLKQENEAKEAETK